MKFIVAVVMLALAGYASAGAVQTVDVANRWAPVGTWGPALVNSVSPHGLGWPVAHGHGWPVAHGLGGVVVGNPWGASPLIGLNQGLIGLGGIHSHAAIHAGIPAVHAGIPALGLAHGLAHEGQYVASNRGAVHVAPLAGHIQSVNSANLQPAPGTTW